MNKQTVIALKNPVNVLFFKIQVLISEKYKFIYSELSPCLISEKSIWKNQVRQTGFLVYFKLDFYCLCSLQKSISKLIFED